MAKASILGIGIGLYLLPSGYKYDFALNAGGIILITEVLVEVFCREEDDTDKMPS